DLLISYEVTPGGATPVDVIVYQWATGTTGYTALGTKPGDYQWTYPDGTAVPVGTTGLDTSGVPSAAALAARAVACATNRPPNAQNELVPGIVTAVSRSCALEVKKSLDPTTDPGRFNLSISHSDTTDFTTATGTPNGVGDGGTTGARTLSANTYTVGENTSGV